MAGTGLESRRGRSRGQLGGFFFRHRLYGERREHSATELLYARFGPSMASHVGR